MGKTGKILGISAIVLLVIILGIFFSIKGTYNRLVQLDEGVKGAWAQVENQLQRRFDLIPNYVETVKGYAKHEKEVLLGVTEARSRVGSLRARPCSLSPAPYRAPSALTHQIQPR